MTTQRFGRIGACVFDAYGTLFDVHSAVGRHAERLGTEAAEISQTWRTKQLEYTWLRSLMRRYVPFAQVTADALDYALDAHGIDDAALRDDLLEAYLCLDAYPEVSAVLERLRSAGITRAILSNGDARMLERAVEAAGLSACLDAVLSVDSVGVYKPDPRVYELACTELGVEPSAVSFQSANAWDAVGAAAYGFRVVWCNRFSQAPERLSPAPDVEARDLNAVLEVLGLSDSPVS